MRYWEWAAIGHANGWLGVRTDDPTTSRKGASSLAVRAGSQRALLLARYDAGSMTDEEAGYQSNLINKPRCCYWKRCSELRQAGFIRPTGVERMSSAGVPQQVCEITEEGRIALASLR